MCRSLPKTLINKTRYRQNKHKERTIVKKETRKQREEENKIKSEMVIKWKKQQRKRKESNDETSSVTRRQIAAALQLLHLSEPGFGLLS